MPLWLIYMEIYGIDFFIPLFLIYISKYHYRHRCSKQVVAKQEFVRMLQKFRPAQTVFESGIGLGTGSQAVKAKVNIFIKLYIYMCVCV
jgi:hypothetical protein